MKYRILEGFPYSKDGIETRMLKMGEDQEIRDDLVDGLKAAGLIAEAPAGGGDDPETERRAAERKVLEEEEERARAEAEAAFAAAAKRKAAGELLARMHEVQEADGAAFMDSVAEVLGEDARGLTKEGLAEGLKLAAEPPAPPEEIRQEARQLVAEQDTLEWQAFLDRAVRILGKDARRMKKVEIVSALDKLAGPPESPDA